ncbi:dephospho-CoA kinase [Oikeobacillus pervagus]|uniref:Dephospho-CoA kinase n=1 Tax=Oikeobacillus pervagus TaxID=1325931 RepID=A0AAJ1WJA1_9BACI|nr:dephospho-CoA kinase [Oikeobacillus pervagus]MDQ0215475.1 dephospho-CoA kinase [Oikeobacillus pervagus]
MVAIIGLTGGIASGKSTVSKMLKEKGFTIIDADVAARVVVEPKKLAYEQIVQTFGKVILQEDGTIDRAKLGSIVFHHEEERLKLNQIVHPAVRSYMLEEKDRAIATGKQTIIMDIPLLFESKLQWMVEKIIVVFVDEETQITRLQERNSFSKEEALARIQSQLPLTDKVKEAHIVIDNSGTVEETQRQVENMIKKLNLIP